MNRSDFESLGDRMKGYEAAATFDRAMPLLPVLARVDGRSFHTFTRGMSRPYDVLFSNAMIETARHLVAETKASMAYTQSDEITLAWYSGDSRSKLWFGGRFFKMTSQLAAQASIAFYRNIVENMPEFADRMPTFDCRVWQVPTLEEAANVFLWREWDATKNSVQMAAQSVCSHKSLQGKNGRDQHEMLHEKGINWNDYPSFFKRGTYLQRHTILRPFTTDEMENLPEKHEARSNPDLEVKRSEIRDLHMPPFSKVTNRSGVIFRGEDPISSEDL